jgi:hypothetical protein
MRERRKKGIGNYVENINVWVILGAFVIASFLLLVSLIFLWVTRPNPASRTASTAELVIIEAPTATPKPVTATLSLETTMTPSTGTPQSEQKVDIIIGGRVQIKGTGGGGLRFRNDPNLDSDVRFIGNEAEVFLVDEGPVSADDYTWWHLIGVFDEARQGWAVADYLIVIEEKP